MRLLVEPDAEAAARAAAGRLAAAAEAGGNVFLSGGSTPRRAYELAAAADWSRAHVWWADERCVPPEDDRSNFRLVRESLLDRLAAAPAGVHRVRGELEPTEAGRIYDAELVGVELDLVLLGLGEDGHTASLFPGSPALDATGRAVAGPPGLEPFVERVTLTLPAIKTARAVVFLVTGAGKAEAARRAFGPADDDPVPARLARSAAGENVAVLDVEAASQLDN